MAHALKQLSLTFASRPSSQCLAEGFDEEFANALAKLESYNKHLYRPNTYLHKWWARRCGSTFRLILKHLVEDGDRKDYYSPGGLEGKIVLDPMMGGGTTLHEAIRLGANVIGADIDPIPVLQARATLSEIPLDVLEGAFEEFFSSLREIVSPYFKTSCPQCAGEADTQFVLYGLKRRCGCGEAVFIDSTVLRSEQAGSAYTLCKRCRAVLRDNETCGCSVSDDVVELVEKGTRSCAKCGLHYADYVDMPYHSRYAPLVVAGRCNVHGLFYKSPSELDLSLIGKADAWRGSTSFRRDDFAVEGGPKSDDLLRRGIGSYMDLFSSRQLMYLHSAISLLDKYDPLVRLNLALLVSTSLEFNSMLCGYKGADVRRPGAIRHVFSHHAYSFPYTALENNPVFGLKASGTLLGLFNDRIRRGRIWAERPVERRVVGGTAALVVMEGEVDSGTEAVSYEGLKEGERRFLLAQGNSACLDLPPGSVDYVVTDPPYFDSVQYSDLAAFFRVWLRKLLPEPVGWEYEHKDSAVDTHKNSNGRYAELLGGIFLECGRVLNKRHGRLVFTFHHWNPKGWAALTLALKRAGFVLVERFVVHSENPVSVHISNLKALTHDAVLVLAQKGGAVAPDWAFPAIVDTVDSKRFCEGCADVLGWMLNSEIAEHEIGLKWQELLIRRRQA